MNLYLLVANEHQGYDTCDGFVIRASSEEKARAIAAVYCGCEGGSFWMDESQSTCTKLSSRGDRGVVLRSYCAG